MIWACDFETYPSPIRTWVWAWGAANIEEPDEFIHGSKISDFIDWLEEQRTAYFHNLKFDGGFIADYLLNNGWEYTHSKPKHQKQFSCLVAKSGQWYMMELKFKKRKVKIYDSLKKLPMPISSIAKAFNLDEKKGDIDYNLYRPEGWEITENELDYLKNDCVILAKALNTQFHHGLSKMTIGADALDDFKTRITKSRFNNLFPELDENVDKEIRSSYRGGWVYCNKPGDYDSSICFDVNSLYPYVMYTFPMPFGKPVYFEGEYKEDKAFPLYVITFRADFKLKEGFLPTIQLKHSRFHGTTEYVTQHWGMGTDEKICLTSVDFEVFQKHYDIFDIEFLGGYKFRAISNLFKDYIDYWMEIKRTTKGGQRTLAKLMLNSLYGKFGKNPDVTRKDVELDNDRIKCVVSENEKGKGIYIPVAAFITAFARRHTITYAQRNYQRFIYADTDSLHLIGTEIPDGLPVHNSNLGEWKVEYQSTWSRYIKPKRYMVETDGKLHITCAGLPDKLYHLVTKDNFKNGTSYYGKLTPVYVPGGVYLKETSFTMD